MLALTPAPRKATPGSDPFLALAIPQRSYGVGVAVHRQQNSQPTEFPYQFHCGKCSSNLKTVGDTVAVQPANLEFEWPEMLVPELEAGFLCIRLRSPTVQPL